MCVVVGYMVAKSVVLGKLDRDGLDLQVVLI